LKKFWRVAIFEYTRHVFRKRFVFALLSIPALLAAMGLVGLLLVRPEGVSKPAGYVDLSGFLANPITIPEAYRSESRIEFIAFSTVDQAQQALEEKRLQSYFILQQDFRQTGRAVWVSLENPNSQVRAQFEQLVRIQLLQNQPQPVIRRILMGNELTIRSVDGSREMGQQDWFHVFIPFFAGVAFMVAIFITSGYLMQAVVEEKENRTMEVLISSVSPSQLMSGKIIGIILVGFTQMLFWIALALLLILVGQNFLSWLKDLQLAASTVLVLVFTFIPSFIMLAALMTAVGATVTEAREGQQITGLFTLPVVIPYWFTYQLMNEPNGPLAVGLSFFPLTAPVALTMRIGFADIPLLQIVANITILILAAWAALWLAGRAFRLGMLRYGQTLSIRQIFGRQG
jgi:ABC-2 type transport system permease protein